MTDDLEKESLGSQAVQDVIPLPQLRNELKMIGRKDFTRKYTNPFFMFLGGPEMDPGIIALSTVSTDAFSASYDIQKSKGVVEIKKYNRNPFESRISIGRGTTNDIIIRSSRISKLHAYLTKEGNNHRLFDAGSRNGTRVNSEKIGADKGVPLLDGDIVQTGKHVFMFLTAEGLIKILEGLKAAD